MGQISVVKSYLPGLNPHRNQQPTSPGRGPPRRDAGSRSDEGPQPPWPNPRGQPDEKAFQAHPPPPLLPLTAASQRRQQDYQQKIHPAANSPRHLDEDPREGAGHRRPRRSWHQPASKPRNWTSGPSPDCRCQGAVIAPPHHCETGSPEASRPSSQAQAAGGVANTRFGAKRLAARTNLATPGQKRSRGGDVAAVSRVIDRDPRDSEAQPRPCAARARRQSAGLCRAAHPERRKRLLGAAGQARPKPRRRERRG